MRCHTIVRLQTAVTAYISSEQSLLFDFTLRCGLVGYSYGLLAVIRLLAVASFYVLKGMQLTNLARVNLSSSELSC